VEADDPPASAGRIGGDRRRAGRQTQPREEIDVKEPKKIEVMRGDVLRRPRGAVQVRTDLRAGLSRSQSDAQKSVTQN
jgi:hypothetical protein